jgi:hypothetical protein
MIADIDKDGRCVQYQPPQHTWHGQEAADCLLDRSDALSSPTSAQQQLLRHELTLQITAFRKMTLSSGHGSHMVPATPVLT